MGNPHRIKAYALIQENTDGSLYPNEQTKILYYKQQRKDQFDRMQN